MAGPLVVWPVVGKSSVAGIAGIAGIAASGLATRPPSMARMRRADHGRSAGPRWLAGSSDLLAVQAEDVE